MAKYQVDFSGARNIIDPLEGMRNTLQQTSTTLGQMIGQDEQRAERLRDEAYRRDALALQQTAAKRDTDKYNQELADRTFAQKTFAAYNQAPTRDYSALPTQLTDTEKGKSVINDMSLTSEELANPTMPSAIAKMKNQQILSDTHDKSGQTLLESERFKAAMASTAKGADGMIPLSMQEKLLGMESAERAAMTAKSERAQKAAELLSKDRSELQRAGLKDATTLAAAEIKAEGKGGGSKKDKKDNTPKWGDYGKLKEALDEEYSFTPWGDAKNVTAVMDRASAAGMKPDELSGLISKHTIRGLVDNTFDTEKVLADINAKKPVLTGGDNGSTTRTPGKFASLDPMAGYGELLKQKDAAYKQAVANTANTPLTQADVLAARSAKGATQLDELIAKLGTTAGKAEVQPETRNIPAPVTAVDEKSVKSKEVAMRGGLNKDGTLNKEALSAINESIAYTGKRLPEMVTPVQANTIVDTLIKDHEIRSGGGETLPGVAQLTNAQKAYKELVGPVTRNSTVNHNAEWYPMALQAAKEKAEQTGDEWAYVRDPNTNKIVDTVPGKSGALIDTSEDLIPVVQGLQTGVKTGTQAFKSVNAVKEKRLAKEAAKEAAERSEFLSKATGGYKDMGLDRSSLMRGSEVPRNYVDEIAAKTAQRYDIVREAATRPIKNSAQSSKIDYTKVSKEIDTADKELLKKLEKEAKALKREMKKANSK